MRRLNLLGVTLAEGAAQKVSLLSPPTGCDFLPSLPRRKVARLNRTYDKFTNVDRLYIETFKLRLFTIRSHDRSQCVLRRCTRVLSDRTRYCLDKLRGNLCLSRHRHGKLDNRSPGLRTNRPVYPRRKIGKSDYRKRRNRSFLRTGPRKSLSDVDPREKKHLFIFFSNFNSPRERAIYNVRRNPELVKRRRRPTALQNRDSFRKEKFVFQRDWKCILLTSP